MTIEQQVRKILVPYLSSKTFSSKEQFQQEIIKRVVDKDEISGTGCYSAKIRSRRAFKGHCHLVCYHIRGF